MPSRCLHLHKNPKITHVKIVISKNCTNKKRSSPTNRMVQYCKCCYSYCSDARILFQQNSSLHGFISNMQKKETKTCQNPLIQFSPPSISNSYLKREMLRCCLTRMYYTNTKMLLFHILQSPLSGSCMSTSISPQKIWQPFFLGKKYKPLFSAWAIFYSV